MKCLLLLTLAVAVYSKDLYTTENDDFNIEALVQNLPELQAFANCFRDKGPCDAVAADFKSDLKEVVEQACAKCTPAQKHILKVFLQGLKDKIPAEYQAFKSHYDPQNIYIAALENAIAKE